MPTPESMEQYHLAQKAAQKEVRERQAAGLPVHPQVLDALLPSAQADQVRDLGVIDIPTHRIVGTKAVGRITAFSPSFLPLLDQDTEFAIKWMNLCDAHLSPEGIRDPILCYEYLGNFYVQEGNKRVSVLRAFDAPRIPGVVRRILPQPSDDPQVLAYYEFLEFYKDAGIYDVQFRVPGDYAKLLHCMEKEPGHPWDQWQQRSFRAYFQYFKDAFYAQGGKKLSLLPEEALLLWLEVYTYADLGKFTDEELRHSISGLWSELSALSTDDPVTVSTEPVAQTQKAGIFSRLLGVTPEHLNIAFVHQMSPATSPWAKGHELGRAHIEKVFGDRITTRIYCNADTAETAEAALSQAVADGAQLVFTTTPRLNRATLKAAVQHPKVQFFNCSVNIPYPSMRTYYCRIFEGKFITGAIAGAMADNDRIGYIASSPIYGVPASINAFALGAQMTNPRAQIDLRWSCQPGDPVQDFIQKGYQVISNRDVPTRDQNYLSHGEYGTYFVEPDGSLMPLASPCWLWGIFYERVVRSILNGTMPHRTDKAMNYWWGMDSGVIDVELSPRLPESMRFLANMLRKGLQLGALDPFRRRIVSQDGTLRNTGAERFSPEALLTMDWLCDNVVGTIPEYEDVLPFAQPMLHQLGIHRERLPLDMEENAL